MSTAWTQALALAEAQFALVTRQQALSTGISPAQWDHAHRQHRLSSIHPGVSRFTGAPVTRPQRILAAVLAAGHGAAAARATAVELHDLNGCRRRRTVSVVVAHQRRVVFGDPSVRLHRSRTLEASDVTCASNIPVTVPARTVCDLAIDEAVGIVREVAADALRKRLTDLSQLDEQSRRAGPTAGAGRRRGALRQLDPDAGRMRSRLESTIPRLLADGGLPRPVAGYRLVEHGRLVAELDFAYPELEVAIEIDGYWWHSTPNQKARDEQRVNALTSRGWRVLRFGEHSLRHNPQQVIGAVRRMLQAAA